MTFMMVISSMTLLTVLFENTHCVFENLNPRWILLLSIIIGVGSATAIIFTMLSNPCLWTDSKELNERLKAADELRIDYAIKKNEFENLIIQEKIRRNLYKNHG